MWQFIFKHAFDVDPYRIYESKWAWKHLNSLNYKNPDLEVRSIQTAIEILLKKPWQIVTKQIL